MRKRRPPLRCACAPPPHHTAPSPPLPSGLGLLAAAGAATDFVTFSLMPLRSVYSQYQGRTTIDFSQLNEAGDTKQLLQRFKSDPFLIDPVPPIMLEVLAARARRVEERRRLLAVSALRASSSSALLAGKDGVPPSGATATSSPSPSSRALGGNVVVINPVGGGSSGGEGVASWGGTAAAGPAEPR